MFDFVCILPFKGITLRVAMATMHFHIAKADLFLETFFCISVVPGNNLTPMRIMRNCPVGARQIKSDAGFKGTPIFRFIWYSVAHSNFVYQPIFWFLNSAFFFYIRIHLRTFWPQPHD